MKMAADSSVCAIQPRADARSFSGPGALGVLHWVLLFGYEMALERTLGCAQWPVPAATALRQG